MDTIIFSDNSLWGCLNFRAEIIKHFISKGYRVVIVAPEDKSLKAEILPDGAIYEALEMQRAGGNPFKDLQYKKQLENIYSKYKPIIVFHYTVKSNIYGTLAAHRLGIPSVVVVTGLGYIFDNNGVVAKIGRMLYRKALKKAYKALFLNSDNLNIMLNKRYIKSDKTILLKGGEGIDLKQFTPQTLPNNKKTIFLMIARVLYDKGYNEYVEAAISNSDAEFRLIGAIDSNPKAVPRDVVENEKHINYMGFMGRNDVLEQIHKADCIVLPSYHEGMSITLTEAIALGKPIITTNIAGCRESVDDGINGYLIPAKNGEALSIACKKLISLSCEQRQSMSLHSRTKAINEFGIDNVINVYEDIIKGLERIN